MPSFEAPEIAAGGRHQRAAYALEGSEADGWTVTRNGVATLRLGPGFRALAVSHCGICSTDLARHHLPFPLPQVGGHEVVALDGGQPVAVEINASHAARGLAPDRWCGTCRAGLPTHCPDRLVLGIHALPGGFAPWMLAPVDGVVPLPTELDPRTACLLEPFAAAWHAVATLAPADGERVAVLGPRRLGALVLAALAAWRARTGHGIEIVAVVRRPVLGELARRVGADEVVDLRRGSAAPDLADVVVDTTGSPEGLALATRLARREVHLKSTAGVPSQGLAHATELVVDELALQPLRDASSLGVGTGAGVAAVLAPDEGGALARRLEERGLRVLRGRDAARLRAELARDADVPLDGADVAVASTLAEIDAAIRPEAGLERPLVHARGVIAVVDRGQRRAGLLEPLLDKGLRVTTSRCGEFRQALPVLAGLPAVIGTRLGDALVTDVVPAARLEQGYAAARDPASVKVVATHPGGLL